MDLSVKEDTCIPPLPRIVNEPKERISKTIAPLNGDMLSRTYQEFECRLDVCHVTWGAHLENLLTF
jgi:hypothetical protein